MIDVATIKTALRAWAMANDPGVEIVHAYPTTSAPRPAGPYTVLLLQAIRAGEYDERRQPGLHGIVALNQGAKTFTVGGDRRELYPVALALQVVDSTGNDGTYTVAAVAYTAPNTTVTVVEAIPSATVNGALTGTRQIAGDRVLLVVVDCIGGPALARAEHLRSSLRLVGTLDNLRASGLAAYPADEVLDLTGLFDTRFEPRARFEARFGLSSRLTEFVGVIESVEHTQTLLDVAGNVVSQKTSTVTGP